MCVVYCTIYHVDGAGGEYTDCGQCEWMTMKRLAKSFVHACMCIWFSWKTKTHETGHVYV